MIKVTKGSIKVSDKKFYPGDTIEGLTEQDEARLVQNGFAEFVVPVNKIDIVQDAVKEDEEDEEDASENQIDEETVEEEAAEAIEGVNVNLDMDDVVVPSKGNKRKK